jgi:hypothetical protein
MKVVRESRKMSTEVFRHDTSKDTSKDARKDASKHTSKMSTIIDGTVNLSTRKKGEGN